MNTAHPVTLTDITNYLNNLFREIDSEEKKALMIAKKIQELVNSEPSRELYISFQIIHGYIDSIVSEDPNKVHRDIVRETLKRIDPKLLDDIHVIDMLSRELVESCKLLKLRLTLPSCIQKLYGNQQKSPLYIDSNLQHHLNILRTDQISPESNEFEVDGMLTWDRALLDTIRNMGYTSRRNALDYEKYFKDRFISTKAEGKDPLHFWFNYSERTKDLPFHTGSALQLLTNAIYQDKAKSTIIFGKKNVPALVTNIYNGTMQLLSPKNKLIEKDNQLKLYGTDDLLGQVDIPTMEDSIVKLVFQGMEKLKSVTSHRLIRFLIQSAFEKKAKGYVDFRVLVFKRGATEIAECLGLSNKKYVGEINQILHALSHVSLKIQDFSGILISLIKRESSVRQAQEYYITLAPPLVPYHANTLRQGNHNRLLIPILPDPPLVNPTQTYQAQFLLQMELMAEFSGQSKMLAEEGVIYVPQSSWEQKALLCGITNEDTLINIQSHWTEGEDFLKRVDSDFYTLTKRHEKVLSFLVDQGKRRIQNSEKGKMSVSKKNKDR